METDNLSKNNNTTLTDKVVFLLLVSYQLYSFMPNYVVDPLKVTLPMIALFLCLLRNNFKLRNTSVTIWIYGFIMMSLITMFNSISIGESVSRLIAMFSVLVFLSALAQYIRNYDDIEKSINYLICGSLLFIIILSITNLNSLSNLSIGYGSFSMEFNNIITPALYYLIWSLIYNQKNRLPKLLITLLFLGFSLLTGFKKAIFFPFVFLALMLLMKNRKNFFKIILSILILLVAIMILYNFVMNNDFLYQVLGRRIQGFMNFFTNEGRVDGSTRTRIGLMEDAWKVFLNNPIMGVGLGAFREATRFNVYAHNNFLELLASTGVIGFVSFYWIHFLLILVFLNRIMKNKAKEMDSLLISILITNILHDIGTISYYRFSYLIPVCLSVCYLNIVKRETLMSVDSIQNKYQYLKKIT